MPDTFQYVTSRPRFPGPVLAALLRRRLALLPVLAFLPIILAPPVNHDVAAVLSFSQRWLAGERLYADLIDVNPPLIFVLNLAPAALAEATGLDAVLALQACLIGVVLLCWRLAFLVRDRAGEGPAERAFLDVLPGLFGFACGYDFGQREILMATAALPYLLLSARRMRGDRPHGRVVVALVAALGFALKPHFLVIPALAELLVLVGRGGLRRWIADSVPWIMAAVWAVYLLSVPLLFPDFLHIDLPLVWSLYLDEGGLSPWRVLLLPRFAAALILSVPLLVLTLRRRAAAPLPLLLAAATLGAIMSAAVQHKGWSYHIVPIELFACGLGGVLAARWLDGLGAARDRVRAQRIAASLGGLFALHAIVVGEAPWKELGYATGDVGRLTALLLRQGHGARVLALSPWVSPLYPALNYAGARPTLRMTDMWLLEGAYQTCPADGRRYHETWEMGRAESLVYRGVTQDFVHAPPAAVVVDRQSGIPRCGSEFDVIAYFSRDRLFAEAWSHYQLVGEAGSNRVFARKD